MLNLEKLAEILGEDDNESAAQEEPKTETKKAQAEEQTKKASTEENDEAVMKVAAEAVSLGRIIGYGVADQLAKIANEPAVDAGKSSGGEGSVAKQKGDKLPENQGEMPADEEDHPLTEEDLHQSPNPVHSKGDSQGKGMDSKKASKKESARDSLARALGFK